MGSTHLRQKIALGPLRMLSVSFFSDFTVIFAKNISLMMSVDQVL